MLYYLTCAASDYTSVALFLLTRLWSRSSLACSDCVRSLCVPLPNVTHRECICAQALTWRQWPLDHAGHYTTATTLRLTLSLVAHFTLTTGCCIHSFKLVSSYALCDVVVVCLSWSMCVCVVCHLCALVCFHFHFCLLLFAASFLLLAPHLFATFSIRSHFSDRRTLQSYTY